MRIHRIPVLSDNYIFLLHDDSTGNAVVVDPAIASPVLNWLDQRGATLVGIWNTHHHSDHVGGNRTLLKHFPTAQVIAGRYDQRQQRIPGQTTVVTEGNTLTFAGRTVQVLDCPGHTLGHIAYYFPVDSSNHSSHLFCGDTLFAGGCGRLFEGTPQQMMHSLAKLRDLPAQTQVWCAHEYTLSNLKFALTVEPHHQDLNDRFAVVKTMRQHDQPTIPTTIATEAASNPFLRWDDENLQQAVQCDRPLELFTKIRQLKDRF